MFAVAVDLTDPRDLPRVKAVILTAFTRKRPFPTPETHSLREGLHRLIELKIPRTVQAILASRIDRSPQDAKELLQVLAVIGREFPLLLIRTLVRKPDDELSRLLNDLQLGERALIQ